jgi:hypothetical protein
MAPSPKMGARYGGSANKKARQSNAEQDQGAMKSGIIEEVTEMRV